uniref:Reverse transcriptase domain-containing protein n=1 Tax=Tanacetum cinerariifolium TaxID=118510 RepID=A0A699H1I8_TANCI|nr:reverse transcriptase domain-containing protein [Tanacetum cinerariifolium]
MNILIDLTMQKQSPSGLGSLPSNTMANPRGDVKAITTQSSVAYDGPTIPPTPSPLPKGVEHETEVTKDKKKLSLLELTPTHMTLELATRSIAYLAGIAEDVFVQVGKFTFPADFIVSDYDVDPCVPLILGRPFLRTVGALVDVHGEELILRDGDEKLIFHDVSTPKHPHKYGNELINMINFIDIICEDRFSKVLKFKKSNHPSGGSTTPLSDSSPSSIPFETSDSLPEEFVDELTLIDPFLLGKEDNNFDFEADLREIEYLLNKDPLTESNIETIDHILEKFIDKPALNYLPPWRMTMMTMMIFLTLSLIMMNGKNFCMVIVISDSTLPEESSKIASLSSSSFRNKHKVFNLGILILGGT